MKTTLVAGLLALATGTPAIAQVMPADKYVATAGASDLYERQSSQVVLETTQNARIKSFATMMIADHGKSTAAVKDAATRSKVTVPPPALTPLQTELVAELRAEKGEARDALYVAQQKSAHGQALAVQKAYAADGKAAALKAAAAEIVPVVEHHIEMLKTM